MAYEKVTLKKDSGNYKAMHEKRRENIKKLGRKPMTAKEYNKWRAKQKKDFPLW